MRKNKNKRLGIRSNNYELYFPFETFIMAIDVFASK